MKAKKSMVLRFWQTAALLLACLTFTACHSTRSLAQKAANGDKAAQFEYGRRLLTGKHAPQNPRKAICWFNIAAQQEHAGAEAALGVCYERGIGVPKDTRQAREWYGRAMAHGHPHALMSLAQLELREKHPAQAVRILEAGSDANLVPAQLTLAYLYMGNEGTPADPARAVDNIRYAAMRGSGEAAFLMFLCFAEGYGVRADAALAYGWLANAADMGFDPARKVLDSLASQKE